MEKIKVFFRRVASGSFKRFFRNLQLVHEQSGKNCLWLFADMIYSMFRYGIGYLDYMTFGFAYIKKDKRLTFMTMDDNIVMARRLNKQDAFYKKYSDKQIEFDCIVYSLAENPDVKDTFDYVFVVENEAGEPGMMLLCLRRANFLNFRWDRKTRPEYLAVGSRLRMRASMTRGNDPDFIYLVPEKSWGR